MKIGLFIFCYVDRLYPGAANVILQWLEKWGATVTYTKNKTCCGQPMANYGPSNTADIEQLLVSAAQGSGSMPIFLTSSLLN